MQDLDVKSQLLCTVKQQFAFKLAKQVIDNHKTIVLPISTLLLLLFLQRPQVRLDLRDTHTPPQTTHTLSDFIAHTVRLIYFQHCYRIDCTSNWQRVAEERRGEKKEKEERATATTVKGQQMVMRARGSSISIVFPHIDNCFRLVFHRTLN